MSSPGNHGTPCFRVMEGIAFSVLHIVQLIRHLVHSVAVKSTWVVLVFGSGKGGRLVLPTGNSFRNTSLEAGTHECCELVAQFSG